MLENFKSNEFFILGVSDSTCKECCQSEQLLDDINNKLKDKASLSYPEKTTNKKGKKVIIRKEIPIVRIDLANKELV